MEYLPLVLGHLHHQLLPYLGNDSEKVLLPSREQTPLVLVISKEQTEPFPSVYSHAISALPAFNCLRNVLQTSASGETSLLWEAFLRRLHRLLITGPALKPTGVHGGMSGVHFPWLQQPLDRVHY